MKYFKMTQFFHVEVKNKHNVRVNTCSSLRKTTTTQQD